MALSAYSQQIVQALVDGNVTAADKAAFNALPPEEQDQIMAAVQQGDAVGSVGSKTASWLGGGGSPTPLGENYQKIGQQVGYQNPDQRRTAGINASQSANQRLIDQDTQRAQWADAQDRGYFDQNVDPWVQTLPTAGQNEIRRGEESLARSGRNTQNWETERRAATAQGNAANQQAVNERDYNLGQYTNSVNQANAQTRTDLGSYMNETDPFMRTMEAGGYGAPVQFDAEGLGMQRQAAGMGQDIYGGSLDYTAAQAHSNAGDVARQTGDHSALKAIAGGSLDAEADPEGIAAQKKALGRFDELSHPEMTAEERFILEQARRAAEQQLRAQRTSVLEDQAFRGVRSGSSELGMMYDTNERVAQDRVMADLGAQANAVQRAQRNLEAYADMGSTIRGMSFDEDNANMDRRFGGAQSAAQVSTAMRNASDNMAMFNTGETNTASANNQATRMQGAGLYAQQANAIRTNNDDINKFNKEQSMIQQRQQENYRQNEAVRVSNLAGSRNDARVTANDTSYNRDADLFGARSGTTSANEGSRTAISDRNTATADDVLANWNDYEDRALTEAERPGNVIRTNAATAGNAAGQRAGINAVGTANLSRAAGVQIGNNTLKEAGYRFGA